MTDRRLNNVQQIAAWRLCMGCGVCAAACPEHNIQLIDVADQGLRPIVNLAKCRKCCECLKVCPGIEISHQPFNSQTIPELRKAWGPVLEVWEGYATDHKIRYKGSSGGVTTAVALFCLDKEQISGVLHIGTKPENPLQNVPVFSKTREELLACTGSRYSPAAPCEKLHWLEESKSSCVFIGKPCDVVALRKSQAVNQALDSKVCLALSIFCAGTPTTNGTYKLLDMLGVRPEEVEQLRYRGYGWPGATEVKIKGDSGQVRRMIYEESWGNILSNYGQLRCRLCPDSTGEFADISCGDPWHREIKPDEQGRSLVAVRTERGRRILHSAMDAGYVELEKVTLEVLPASQKALLNRRQNLFGRLLAMRILRIPIPVYAGFFLFRNWLRLSTIEKIRSFGGTLKRIVMRRLIRPLRPIISGNKFPSEYKSQNYVSENLQR
jgi:coenzyme F420 hydrogenase subunit beta